MDRATRWIGVLGVLSLLTVAGVGLAENPEQSGSGTTCADFTALWAVDGATFAGQTDNIVDADAGTGFQVSSDQGTVHVDFYNDDDQWIGYNAGNQSGAVPADATHATVCVGQLTGFWPDAPAPDAEWTYQDGFPVS